MLKTVEKTKKLDLCLSCEICVAVCPNEAITTTFESGQFLPMIRSDYCTKCGICLELCPGIDVDPFNLRLQDENEIELDFNCLKAYTIYSKNKVIRKNSTSGGAVTTLLTELLKNKEFDAAFVLIFDHFNGKPARLKQTSSLKKISEASKSKYIPASVFEVINTIKSQENQKYIIVGTPCQFSGILKCMAKFGYSRDNFLFLGLFCDKTLNYNVLRYYEDVYGEKKEKMVKFDFRTKEKDGWPGNSKIIFDSERTLIIDRIVRTRLKPFFQLNRCLFCLNGKLNPQSDISFGDCYIKEEFNPKGVSNIIVRTKKGEKILENNTLIFNKKSEDIDRIIESQQLKRKIENLRNVKILASDIYPEFNHKLSNNITVRKKLDEKQKFIKLGKKYHKNRIKLRIIFPILYYKIINMFLSILQR